MTCQNTAADQCGGLVCCCLSFDLVQRSNVGISLLDLVTYFGSCDYKGNTFFLMLSNMALLKEGCIIISLSHGAEIFPKINNSKCL